MKKGVIGGIRPRRLQVETWAAFLSSPGYSKGIVDKLGTFDCVKVVL